MQKNKQGWFIQFPALIASIACVGVGMSSLAFAQTSPIQSNNTLVAQLMQNQGNLSQNQTNSDREEIFFEMKGDEVKQCRVNNKGVKECNEIGRGYKMGLRIGNDLYNQGNFVNAETILRQLTDRYPKEPEGQYRLGTVLMRQGKTEEAISKYRETIKLNSEHAKAHNDLGVVLASQGEIELAITEWKQALKINSEYAEALSNLGVALLQTGDKNKEEGINNLKKARNIFKKQGRNQAANRIEEILKKVTDEKTIM